MSFKKKMLAVAAVSALTVATAVPAMALENEFHGMYKFMGFQTNFFNGVGANLADNAHSGFMAEQRARINYIAKANDDLKLVTHFELDARFGGRGGDTASNIYTAKGDAGKLDADALSLETKNIYLDFNCPITGANFKVGLQPWADAYNSLFLLADMTGVSVTKKFDPATVSLGWFRYDDNTQKATVDVGQSTGDLIVLDGKFAINKDMKVGVTYYNVQNDASSPLAPTTAAAMTEPHFELLHMVGINADLTFGPATVKPFFVYEFGDFDPTTDIKAFMGGATAKVKVGPGAVNLAAIYLSGQGENDNDLKAFQPLTAGTTYFNPANMWLLIRGGQQINSSTSVLGNDLTVGAHGLLGVFAGYEGTMDKLFYNANVGYAQAAKSWGSEEKSLGTEINAQVGYKLFDNLSASAAVAYLILGDGLGGNATERLHNAYGKLPAAGTLAQFGANNADNPYMVNVQLSYAF
jgi:hypothetical protein